MNKCKNIIAIFMVLAIVINGNVSIVFAATYSKEVLESSIFSQREIIENIEVSVWADEGVFPSNSILSIKRISDDIANIKIKNAISKDNNSSTSSAEDMYCFDITILDNQGNELQPDTSMGEVFVTFKNIENIDNNKDNVQIWHINDYLDKAVQINNNVEVKDKEIKFEVEHFSIYTVLINNTYEQSIKYFEGANDDTSYYMIENEEDLSLFRDIVNGTLSDPITLEYINEDTNKTKENFSSFDGLTKNARVMNNITLGNKWQPIGTSDKEYNGTFIGFSDNCTINNLVVDSSYTGDMPAEGLFEYVGPNAKINIKVNNNSYELSYPQDNVKYLKGAGTAKSPYIIEDADDMKYMRDTINNGIDHGGSGIINGTEGSVKGISACYKLTDDINLGENWIAICQYKNYSTIENSFSGTIDGNNKTITYSSNNEGLIGMLYNGGIIKNLTVDVNINDTLNPNHMGAISAENYGNINNCTVSGQIIYEDNPNCGISLGGITGINRGDIDSCIVSVDIIVENSGILYLGKITGWNSGHINNCEVSGFISTNRIIGNNYEIGGIVGINYTNAKVNNSDADVKLQISNCVHAYIGGIAGESKGIISNSKNKTQVNISESNSVTCGGASGINYGEVYNTSNEVDFNLNASLNSGGAIGGIVGSNTTGSKIYNNFVKGEIKRELNYTSNPIIYVGGIVGENSEDGEADNCYSLVDLSLLNGTTKGNIAGNDKNGRITYCYGNDNFPFIQGTTTQDALRLKLNEHATAQGYSQWILPETGNNGYPIVNTSPSTVMPPFDEYASSINIYGNGRKLLIKEVNAATVISYEDENKQWVELKTIASNNTKKVNVFGGFKENYGGEYDKEGYIVMEGGKVDTIYGGSYKCDMQSSSTVIIKGGKVGNIYGGGLTDTDSMTARVLSGTTIEVQGGAVSYIDANGVDNSSSNSNDNSTNGTKLIKISGSPTIGTMGYNTTGVNIDTFTNKRAIIVGALIGNANSIVIKTSNVETNDIVASLNNDIDVNTNALYVDGIGSNQGIYKTSSQGGSNYKYDIKIVEVNKAILSSESSNIQVNNSTNIGLGFGNNAVAKGYPWSGTLSTQGNYVLPATITVKLNGTELLNGVDYSYNRYSGIITVFKEKTIGDIEVSANAIYVPPIEYVDIPTITTDKLIYNGKSQCPNIDENDAYTVDIHPEINVGEYTATISLKDKKMTKWKDGSTDNIQYKWSINQVDLHITANNNSIIYGDNPTAADVKYDGFVNNEDQSVLNGNLQYTYDYEKYDSIGNYSIMPRGYESNNYNIIYNAGTLKVEPKKLSFKWPSTTEFKHDGKTKEIKASIVGIVNKDDVYISSYSNNKAIKIGTYNAKIKAITGKDRGNYTIENAENLYCKWFIIKNTDEENQKEDDDKKDNDEQKNSNKENNKDNSNNTNKNNTNSSNNGSNSSNKTTNTSPIDLIGDSNIILKESIEGVKNDNGEIIVTLNNGTIISANGTFDNQIRLMVRVIKKTRKEWNWIKNVTKKFGNSIVAYDVFFVNSVGKRVSAGDNTKISIISRERNQAIEVYYLNSNGESTKLKSVKENYTIKFNMKENGYYSLVINDKNISINDELDKNDNIEDTEVNESNNDNNENLQNDSIGENSGLEEEKDNSLENSNKSDETTENITSKKSSKKQSTIIEKEAKDRISLIYIIISILIISSIILILFYNKKKMNKD